MSAVLAAASYSRIGFRLCLTVSARRVRVPGGSAFHLEQVTIGPMYWYPGGVWSRAQDAPHTAYILCLSPDGSKVGRLLRDRLP